MQPGKHLVILTSGIGLGLYIPALIIANNLQHKGYTTAVHVFEDYITAGHLEKIERSKSLFREKFAAGILSQKILTDKQDSTEQEKAAALLDSWLQNRQEHFLVLSGSWIYLLNKYRTETLKRKIHGDLLYLDYSMPLSWRSLAAYCPGYNRDYNEIPLYNQELQSVNFRIAAANTVPVPFALRANRCVIHGGGWGLGTFKQRIGELTGKNIPLDITLSEPAEQGNYPGKHRFFISDPAWSPFNQPVPAFPGIGEVTAPDKIRYVQKKEYHPFFDLIRTSHAIISKGGGGTLVDSLAAATPVIFLEPYGIHEQENAQFWQRLQFGISYAEWKKADYSQALLARMHENLLKAFEKIPAFESRY